MRALYRGLLSIVFLTVFVLGNKKALKLLNSLCTGKCKREDAKYIVVYDDPVIQSLEYEIFLPPQKLSFEGKMYNCPNRITDYLTAVYGETYMELPPEAERATHEPIKIAF